MFFFCLFSLPAEEIRRVNALRNLQAEHHKIEASFFEEVHALECHYLSKYQPLYEKVFQGIQC
jgi:nucleosome assembly protein 1-like 1